MEVTVSKKRPRKYLTNPTPEQIEQAMDIVESVLKEGWSMSIAINRANISHVERFGRLVDNKRYQELKLKYRKKKIYT